MKFICFVRFIIFNNIYFLDNLFVEFLIKIYVCIFFCLFVILWNYKGDYMLIKWVIFCIEIVYLVYMYIIGNLCIFMKFFWNFYVLF